MMAKALAKDRIELLEVMRPKPSPVPLVRVGGGSDGAYLLPDDLRGIAACFSPGVSTIKHFEDELIDRFGIPSHMCDYSADISRLRTPMRDGQTFRKLWLDTSGAENTISLNKWVKDLHPSKTDDLLLQMDIEGAEYRNLLATTDAVLKRFRILVIELHRLEQVNNSKLFEAELGPLLHRFDKHFVCVHAHPNNCRGQFHVSGSTLNLPYVHELTFLRRDRLKTTKRRFPILNPHPLDIPQNVPAMPPVFLNDNWVEGERPIESRVRMLEDELAWMNRRFASYEEEVDKAWRAQYQLAQQDQTKTVSKNQESSRSRPGNRGFTNLAMGASFSLSSWRGARSSAPQVQMRRPFFFHTKIARHQRITIDLGAAYTLSKLTIVNRSDMCMERATQLYYSVHDSLALCDSVDGSPVAIDDVFLTSPGSHSETDLGGVIGQYVTIYSTAVTALHFSDVQIWGKPV